MGLTIGGIALCLVMMLFLLGVYRGVAEGSVDYIRCNSADFWVLQQNAWNILRGSSLLTRSHGTMLADLPAVKSISPVLLLLSTVRKQDRIATLFLAGYDPRAKWGGPPRLAEGRSVTNDSEIVLDQAFAAKFGFKLGDTVLVQSFPLRVVGISTGTNALVIQYAFVTLPRAHALIGFTNIVTCYLVELKANESRPQAAGDIKRMLPGVEVYDQATFLQNNIREMQTGFLPFLFTVAALGVVVLTAILSLLLSINILERRKDFAVLKVLGAPGRFLPRLIIKQALLISSFGLMAALALFFPLAAAVEKLTPEIATRSTPTQIAVVALSVWTISVLSSLVSMQRLRRIYPLEAFA